MADDFALLTVQAYSEKALLTDRTGGATSLNIPLLGLFGEIGSLLSEVKKKQRDAIAYRAYASGVVEELGDVLWYLSVLAARRGLALAEVVANIGNTSGDWRSPTDLDVTFAELQPPILSPSDGPTAVFEATLLKLAASVGLLLADQSGEGLADDRESLGRHLADIFEQLIVAANEAGVTLEAAAIKNQTKIFDRWPQNRVYPALLDDTAPSEEQLPRSLAIEISEREVAGKLYVHQTCNGLNIGDRLTDNAMAPDDYRYHDVFHYAYVAVLGWSPVTRRLFRLKRKSDPKIDEAEDGARAILIEEGITTWIFGQAVEMDFYAGLNAGDLPLDLLKQIRQFVSGYEAEQCPAWLWEDAILQGYAAFRFLREHRRGRIILNADDRQLHIEPFS